jgi:subtilisin family serine protease
VRVLVDLRAQVDLERLGRALFRRGDGRRERRAAVVAALEQAAARSQERLRPFLAAELRAGRIRSWSGFAVVNRLLVEATPEGIASLARRPEVAALHAETELPVSVLATDSQTPLPEPRETTSWALAAIGAPAAWERGLDGHGVVVGLIDSGASVAHEQLAAGFRGGERSWLDPRGRSASPADTRFGHGTGVLSCAVGGNVSGVTLGVAPGARWIACAGLPDGRYNNVLATICADWMLTTGQPDVLLIAWLLPTAGCDRSLQPIVDAWRAAEILPVFAAGNHGPGAGTDRSPANYSGLYPGGSAALSVGGFGRDGAPWANTSRGPSGCGGRDFPLLAAPAEDLVAAFPITRTSYLRADGTSFAAGLTAGAAAILLQRDPQASVTELEAALRGRLDVPAALERLKARASHPRAR